MNDIGTVFYAVVSLVVVAVIALDQRYRIFPRDPKRRRAASVEADVDVSERETVKIPALREPVAR